MIIKEIAMRNKKNNIAIIKGTTLVEVLFYCFLMSSILSTISAFYLLVVRSRVKNQTVAEVEEGGVLIMSRIVQTVRNAEGINFPVMGESSSLLSLDMYDEIKDPTVFDISNGVFRVKEGTADPIPLTSNRVTASELVFTNLSRESTPGTIRIQFTLTHVNLSGRNEYDYSKTFIGSATVRPP